MLRRDSGLNNAEIVELIAKKLETGSGNVYNSALDVHSTAHKRDIYLNQTNQK